jgi:two-component system, OmpR family, sensor kinase
MRQFLADASHELRTPLTSIRGYAELSRLQGKSTNAPDDPMRRIEVEGTRMSRLVEDLLVLARGDDQSTELHRELLDVDIVLRDAIRSVRSAHPERSFALSETGGATILGDRDQLLRLLINLLNNSAMHTAPDGLIRLEGQWSRGPADHTVVLRVIDAGPGLAPEDASHVFERFWRADKARSRARGGSGLGMAIVAQIAEAHGGTVRFESSVAGGTTVTVTLPLATTANDTDDPYPEAADVPVR